ADKQRAYLVGREGVAAINGDTGGAREVAGYFTGLRRAGHDLGEAQPGAHNAPRLVRADAFEIACPVRAMDVEQRRRSLHIRIIEQVTAVVHQEQERVRVVTRE